ncbi:hypothetical protein KSS87_001559 [Heliosperma pusillum]|nr:hypothetical protein KSS87_001559 [Heliosperma pusillum]
MLRDSNTRKGMADKRYGLNDYERIRNERIAQNKTRLQEFGILKLANSMKSLVDSKKRKAKSKEKTIANEKDTEYNPHNNSGSGEEFDPLNFEPVCKKVIHSGGRQQVRVTLNKSTSAKQRPQQNFQTELEMNDDVDIISLRQKLTEKNMTMADILLHRKQLLEGDKAINKHVATNSSSSTRPQGLEDNHDGSQYEKECGLQNDGKDIDFDAETTSPSNYEDSDEYDEEIDTEDEDEQVNLVNQDLELDDHRLSQRNMHTIGAKSFAVVREKMKNEHPAKEAPSLAEMFERTRRPNEGKKYYESYDDTTNRIENMKHYVAPQDGSGPSDAYLGVMGKGYDVFCRLYGRGVSNKKLKMVSGETSYVVPGEIVESLKASLIKDIREDMDARINETNKQMQEEHFTKMAELENNQREIVAERESMTQDILHKILGKLPPEIVKQYLLAALRVLAYGTSTDSVDEYLRMSDTAIRDSLKLFVDGVIDNFETQYLCRPTPQDLARLLHMGEARGFSGMLGSIDCMHWEWKNCPTSWAGQYSGRSGSLNDINVLQRSPLFNGILEESDAPTVNFEVNGALDVDGSGRSKQSRSEKKSRKAMLKLGMKPITGVSRVTVKKSKNILFVISKPDVFKSPTSDTYVIFGEAKIEDLSSQLQTQAAEQFKAPDLSSLNSKPETSAVANDDEANDDEDEDPTGVEPKDIDLVMTQAGVSKGKAIRALKASNGDIVTAIMDLTN